MKPHLPEALELLQKASLAFAQIENNGIRIDTDFLDKSIKETGEKIREIETSIRSSEFFKEWRRRHGIESNLDSPQQLGKMLFDVMGIEHPMKDEEFGGRTKKEENGGIWKTDEEVLSKIDLPFTKDFLRQKKLKKLRSTYLLNLKRELVDGYFHPNFNRHTAATYRSSSSGGETRGLNFQNLPIRNAEFAEAIRRNFIPRKGRMIAEPDESQIEVRIAACYCKDPVLIKYITDPTSDMHRDSAMDLFFLSPEQVDRKTTRDWAKNRFVFPSFYGSVWFQTAPNLWDGVLSGAKLPNSEITVKKHLRRNGIRELGPSKQGVDSVPGTFAHHVRQCDKKLWERFKVYAQWKRDTWDKYQRQGYLQSHTGFVMTHGKEGPMKRNDSGNYEIQGSSFHCVVWAIIKIQKWLNDNKMRTKILGQIHDCLLLDVPPNELQDVLHVCKKFMTTELMKAWKWIIVPLETEVDVTPQDGSWHSKAPWIIKDGLWQPKQKAA